MWLKDSMRKQDDGEMRQLDLDSFGELMDEIVKKSDVGLAVTKKAGADDWEVHGAGCGAVMDFYIFLNALEPVFLKMLDEMDRAGGIYPKKLAKALCEVLENTLVDAAEKRKEKQGGK